MALQHVKPNSAGGKRTEKERAITRAEAKAAAKKCSCISGRWRSCGGDRLAADAVHIRILHLPRKRGPIVESKGA
jgi:hypothetical protein